MKVTNIALANDGLKIALSGVTKITAVYMDRASNYSNSRETDAGKHTYSPSYLYNNGVLHITLPNNSLTFFTISIFQGDDVVVTMYLNQFSLFKAKSKYLQIFEGCCNCNSNHNLMCTGCGEKTKRNKMLTYMLRLNLFQECYKNKNTQLAVKYYLDACRIYDLDNIYFEFLDFNSYYNGTSANIIDLFNTLNDWIKGNACNCEKKVLESLLINDLYSLLFGDVQLDITDDLDTEVLDMYCGYLSHEDIGNWDIMTQEDHNFQLTAVDINNGISHKTLNKTTLTSKEFVLNIPDGVGCIVILIPKSAYKNVMKWNGINEWVKFTTTDGQVNSNTSQYGVVSNGLSTITIDGIVYSIYGEDYMVSGERKIKVN